MIDVQAYLDRMGYRGPLAATAETLRRLQLAHLETVPFENFSIHRAEPIVLDDEALFDKVVARRRGGFCYELNGLFAALLDALGFEVAKLSARVAEDGGGFSPAFDHMTLRVRPGEGSPGAAWLVDVGFGDTFREPLRLGERGVQPQLGRAYRIDREGERFTLFERKSGEAWKPQYRFARTGYRYEDFAPMCRYHQTSPDSHFRKRRLCTLATPDGRVTLADMRFIESTLAGDRRERQMDGPEEYAEILRDQFGIVLG